MVNNQTIFKYKTIKGPLHKIPPLLKLILLLSLSILCMYLPSIWLLTGIILAIIFAFLFKFTIKEQLTDLKPAIYYVIILYTISIISNLTEGINYSLLTVLNPQQEFIKLALRLILIIQLSAFVFRTTSALEIRSAIRIEVISLFISFIPEVFQLWANINQTWRARNGKRGLKKIKMLSFSLISLSFEKAAQKTKAIRSRGV